MKIECCGLRDMIDITKMTKITINMVYLAGFGKIFGKRKKLEKMDFRYIWVPKQPPIKVSLN